VLLVGKDINNMDNLSKTFWEHDKKHIEFIVDVLTRIEESDSERLTFLSQLSHELRRPITEMVSRNEYVIKTATRNIDSYSKKQLIKEMQDNFNMCDNFKYIIEDVELIYSMSKGEVRYDFEMADLKKVIVDSIRLFEDEARVSKNIEIKTYLVKMPEKLYIDKSRMKQVAINLLKNAIQYSLPQEKISISYEYDEKEDCHEINFSNNGIPINPKEKEAIFEMFFRSKQAVEKRPSGTGIGLYLVKQIMKAHGGDCFVKEFSFPTTFTIQIPNQNSEL
jgi:two-component system sensor histidine kinase VicK